MLAKRNRVAYFIANKNRLKCRLGDVRLLMSVAAGWVTHARASVQSKHPFLAIYGVLLPRLSLLKGEWAIRNRKGRRGGGFSAAGAARFKCTRLEHPAHGV